jgi:hypothetical protein
MDWRNACPLQCFVRSRPAKPARMLVSDLPAGPVPTPATLRSPQNGRFPIPAHGARFGDFEWQSSTSEDVVAEIAEFSYHDDARLVLLQGRSLGVPRHVSSGQLWPTQGEWAWRVWSISRSGEIAFSEVRTFVHWDPAVLRATSLAGQVTSLRIHATSRMRNGHGFQTLVREVARSLPFQSRRAEAVSIVVAAK